MSEGYYQIQAAIIQAAATLAAGMPKPGVPELQRIKAPDEKTKLMEVYQERFQMAYMAINAVLADTMSYFPLNPLDTDE